MAEATRHVEYMSVSSLHVHRTVQDQILNFRELRST